MKIQILIDNDTLDEAMVPEAGFSAFITDENKQILFDTGREGNLIANARHLGIGLTELDYIILSHGHHDHSNGLFSLLEMYRKNRINKENRPTLIAHYDAFYPRWNPSGRYIGTKLSRTEIEAKFKVFYTAKPYKITQKLTFLGQIPRKNSFEGLKALGKIDKSSLINDDFILDDTALVYEAEQGLIIISGCSHSGICHIIDHAAHITGIKKIDTVIGGLHLKNETPEFISRTIAELKNYQIKSLHACHCTGPLAREMLKKELPQTDIGCSYSAVFG